MSYREGWGSHGQIFISNIEGLRYHPIDSPEGKRALKEYEKSQEDKKCHIEKDGTVV